MEKKKFGNFIKEHRLKKGYTQKELADLLFIDVTAVSKWERGISYPDITLISSICKNLEVSEKELIESSNDSEYHKMKTEAKKWRAFSLSWSLFFYISYAIALIPCFICDLVVNKGLTWFWIVLSALLLAFTFTNLPKLIKKHKLILIPLSMFLALCLLLGVCCIYTKGDWFWIAILSVLLGLIIIFTPIYIAKYQIFSKIKKYGDFVSLGIDLVMLNILLFVCERYALSNGYTTTHWFVKIAVPITLIIYAILNILLCVKFIKVNKLLKTSIVLILINLFMYTPPTFVKLKDTTLQRELVDDMNVFKANFSSWKIADNNIHCIIALTLLGLSVVFLIGGLILHFKRKREK